MTEFEFSAIKNDTPFSVGNLKTFDDVIDVANMAISAGFVDLTVIEIDFNKGTVTMSLAEAVRKLGRKTIDGTVPSEIIYTKEGKLRDEVIGYMQTTGAVL